MPRASCRRNGARCARRARLFPCAHRRITRKRALRCCRHSSAWYGHPWYLWFDRRARLGLSGRFTFLHYCCRLFPIRLGNGSAKLLRSLSICSLECCVTGATQARGVSQAAGLDNSTIRETAGLLTLTIEDDLHILRSRMTEALVWSQFGLVYLGEYKAFAPFQGA